MKTCRIYELSVREDLVPEFSEVYHTHYFNNTTCVDNTREGYPTLNMKGYIVNTPIQEFSTVRLPNMFTPDEAYSVDREYIIIDPHLEKLLTAKYQNKIKDLESDLEDVKVEYNNFKGMSFWSRVKFLFKGGKYVLQGL